jgi:hypothetical protein
MRVAVWVMIAGLALGWGASARAADKDDTVQIEKAEVKVEYKRFDPDHPPTPPPPIEKGEAAITLCRFDAEVYSRYRYTQPGSAPAGPVKTDVTVDGINVKLTLSVTIWLPDNANKELAAHEEGHRWIAEKYYADAEQVIRPMAQQCVGKRLKGEGRDAKSAARSANDTMTNKLYREYIDTITASCQKAHDIYDKVTEHGQAVRPGAKEGMEQALAEARKGEKR